MRKQLYFLAQSGEEEGWNQRLSFAVLCFALWLCFPPELSDPVPEAAGSCACVAMDTQMDTQTDTQTALGQPQAQPRAAGQGFGFCILSSTVPGVKDGGEA